VGDKNLPYNILKIPYPIKYGGAICVQFQIYFVKGFLEGERKKEREKGLDI
jgi:hypothetical protein